MNHFFALELSDEDCFYLARRAAVWQAIIPAEIAIDWYDPADYHLTLKFLGDISVTEQEHLILAAEPIAAQIHPFVVCSEARLGAIPNRSSPRILWTRIIPSKPLTDLAAQIDLEMAALGYEAERRSFSPHITVARCRSRQSPVAVPLPPHSHEEWSFCFKADHFALRQTLPPEQRAKEGEARYNTVQTFPFGRY